MDIATMTDYSALLTEARKSRFVLVRELVVALEVEMAENERLRSQYTVEDYFEDVGVNPFGGAGD
jgi:hypothetical protein